MPLDLFGCCPTCRTSDLKDANLPEADLYECFLKKKKTPQEKGFSVALRLVFVMLKFLKRLIFLN